MTGEPQRAERPASRPAPVRMEAARRVLRLEAYAPYYLMVLSATLSARASARFREAFGVGVSDWRVVATLAQEPGASAKRIVSVIVLDKAAVSRALAGLSSRGLVEAVSGDGDPRRKSWFLTEAGWDLHDGLLQHALQQEALLTEGIPAQDMDLCLSALSRMLANVRRAEDETGGAG